MEIRSFRDLTVWRKSMELARVVYCFSDTIPPKERFGLISQMQRAAVSIPSNIAEGFKRNSRNDSVHFYNIAEASLEDLKYQLLLAKDLKYIRK